MRFLTALVMMLGLGTVSSTAMANKVCSPGMYERADASFAGAVGSWTSLQGHQKIFASCNDGAFAEGHSDAVVTLFAYRWKQFDSFVALSRHSLALRRWAIGHVDASTSHDELTKVVCNPARGDGSAWSNDLCRQIGKTARDALKN